MNLDTEETHEIRQFEELIQGLIDKGYGCCNDFLLSVNLAGLLANLKRLQDEGDLRPAGIGKNSDFHKNQLIRGDKINWINESSVDPFELIYMKKIQRFVDYLNATCYTSILSFESHYASYEKGSFYKRHIDQFKSEHGRKFSIVLYLNENWITTDGGQLSLYPKGLAQEQLLPFSGRLVFFRSDEMEHEVSPSTNRDRHSIAGWLKN